jgi:hypothetical protein
VETVLFSQSPCTIEPFELAHLGHQGIVKTKQLLHEKVWFQNDIDKMVEANVKMCLPCQASTQGTSSPPEPLEPSLLQEKAYTNVAVDFVGPFPSGEYLIVVIDEYSQSRTPQFQSLMPYSPDKASLRFSSQIMALQSW